MDNFVLVHVLTFFNKDIFSEFSWLYWLLNYWRPESPIYIRQAHWTLEPLKDCTRFWVIGSSRAEIIAIDVDSTTQNNWDDVCKKSVLMTWFFRESIIWPRKDLRSTALQFYVNHSMLLLNLTKWNPNKILKAIKGQVRD